MARAAFVMDRFMQFLGLPGKAFIPMIVGFGCTVPGIMGTRTLESTKDRYTTIFMTPFMSCGARLPVYALFVAALFPDSAGLVVFSIYLSGIVLAVLTGLLLKHTLFRGSSSHFVMELPPYHAPRLGYVIGNSLDRVKSFVLRAGTVIALAVAVLSLLNSIAVTSEGVTFGNQDSEESLLSATGRAITPVFTPLGIQRDNWPATVGLFTGIFAKEAIVGTLNSLYAQTSDTQTSASPNQPGDLDAEILPQLTAALVSIPENLAGIIQGLLDPLGLSAVGEEPEDEQTRVTTARLGRMFTPAAGYAYLLFVLIYTPCLAAMGAAIREMGRTRAILGLGVYLVVLAWVVSVLFYQIAEGGSLWWILTSLATLMATVFTFWLIGRRKAGFRPQGVES
jgi:ferrous iron transport protein B